MPKNLGSVTIYRDTYGVPHIYGDSEEAALYGQGYAAAQDRLHTILKSHLKIAGRTAEVFGPEWVEHDTQVRMSKHIEISKEGYHTLGDRAKSAIEAFLAGIRRYMTEHPDEVPDWAPEMEPYHIVAISRYSIWSWPVRQAMAKLEALKKSLDTGEGSNSWVIGRERSADGCVIGLIDPHVPWKDEWLFYEVHLHGGDLNVYGFNVAGAPYVAIGHNEFVYWTCTTGAPDCSDVYIEELNPDNPLQYQYNGEWHDCDVQHIEVKVKTEDGMETVTKDVPWTRHGPIVGTHGPLGASVKLSYLNECRLLEQFAAMNKAKNLSEFINAMGMLQLMPQNVLYGDVHGDMYYVRNGRVPIRPEGFDFSQPVPGMTDETEWLGIHPYEDLVQAKNPPAGFMQNCNISPGTMTVDSPMMPDGYPSYIYNASPTGSNPRGDRFLTLMKGDRKITREEALAIANDTTFHDADRFTAAVGNAFDAKASDFADLREAVDLVQGWDGQAAADSRAMALVHTWWRLVRQRDESLPGAVLQGECSLEALECMREAVEYLNKTFGRIDVPWGEVFRMRRGDRTWPLSGTADAGLVTLRAVGGPEPDDEGRIYAWRGQTAVAVVFLGETVTAYSAVPYGQSERPESPHFCDQADELFSKCRLKPTWFQKADLLQHLESELTLRCD